MAMPAARAADTTGLLEPPAPTLSSLTTQEPHPALVEGYRAYERGDLDNALRAYREALSSSPQDASLWYDLGCLQAMNQQPDEAKAALRHAISLDPRLTNAYDALGQLYEQDGHADVAQALYANADAVTPAQPKLLRHLIRALLRLNATAPARRALRELLLAAPADLDARYQLGVLELRADAPESAFHEFQVILEQAPDRVMAWHGAALASVRIGALNEARRAWQRALALDPTFEPAAKNLEALDELTPPTNP